MTIEDLLEELDAATVLSRFPHGLKSSDVQRALDDDGHDGAEHDDHLDGVSPQHRLHAALGKTNRRTVSLDSSDTRRAN